MRDDDDDDNDDDDDERRCNNQPSRIAECILKCTNML